MNIYTLPKNDHQRFLDLSTFDDRGPPEKNEVFIL